MGYSDTQDDLKHEFARRHDPAADKQGSTIKTKRNLLS